MPASTLLIYGPVTQEAVAALAATAAASKMALPWAEESTAEQIATKFEAAVQKGDPRFCLELARDRGRDPYLPDEFDVAWAVIAEWCHYASTATAQKGYDAGHRNLKDGAEYGDASCTQWYHHLLGAPRQQSGSCHVRPTTL